MFAASWIQFQTHDWFSHGESSTGDVFRIPLTSTDPRRRFGISQLTLGKTVADPRSQVELSLLPPVFKNEVTHWWDATASANGMLGANSVPSWPWTAKAFFP